jgi:hypothetical protein
MFGSGRPCALALIVSLSLASSTFGVPLIINEYNAVAPDNYTGGDTWSVATGSDSFFATYPGLDSSGLVQGNGGNWIELVITEDHVDIRGWKLVWEEEFFEGGFPLGTRGGEVTFSPTASLFSDLRRGTIITIGEQQSIEVDVDLVGVDKNRTRNLLPEEVDVTIDLSTNTSYDPQQGDWWIHLSTKDEVDKPSPLVTTVVNNPDNYNGDAPKPGDFPITHDDWSVSIRNAANQLVLGPLGEAFDNSGIGGVNSREVVKLEENPSATPNFSSYKDGSSSSFGQPNLWGGGLQTQDFTALRSGLTFILAGDYNNDGRVDAADYTVWRNSLGSTTQLAANGDDTGTSQGVIDAADYLVWKNHYGEGQTGDITSASSAVPEPTTWVAVVGTLALATYRRVRAYRRPGLDTLS